MPKEKDYGTICKIQGSTCCIINTYGVGGSIKGNVVLKSSDPRDYTSLGGLAGETMEENITEVCKITMQDIAEILEANPDLWE